MKFIQIIIAVVILAAGGYVGYRVFFKGETIEDVADDVRDKAGASYQDAKDAYKEEKWKEAAAGYREAIKNSLSSGDSKQPPLGDDELKTCYKNLANALFSDAEKNNWPKERSREAIEACNDYIEKHKLSDEEKKQFMGKIADLKSKSGI